MDRGLFFCKSGRQKHPSESGWSARKGIAGRVCFSEEDHPKQTAWTTDQTVSFTPIHTPNNEERRPFLYG